MAVFCLGERRPKFIGEEWFIAPNAAVIGSAVLHNQTSVWFGAVIRADSETIAIGERTNVQDGAVLHVDPGVPLVLGRGVSIGHKAMLHGCTVGDNVLIGIGSVVLNRAVIGKNSIVGAGAVVPEGKSFPEGVLLLGMPAKVVRELSPQELALITKNADLYVQRARLYREQLRPQRSETG